MGQLDSDGAFADGGGYAFDGPVAYVAGGEDSGQTGLQEQRWPRERPAGARLGAGQVTPGQHIASLVAVDRFF